MGVRFPLRCQLGNLDLYRDGSFELDGDIGFNIGGVFTGVRESWTARDTLVIEDVAFITEEVHAASNHANEEIHATVMES